MQNRPESTNSLSSQYSTSSSSTRSVIYRPLAGGGGGDPASKAAAASARGGGSGSGGGGPPPSALSSSRPRVSPIIRTPSASPSSPLSPASSGQGQGHKKVSFSDSEATEESCETSFEDLAALGGGTTGLLGPELGGVGVGEVGEGGEGRLELETTPARYSLSDMDAAVGSDSDSLTRHGKAGVARQFQRLRAGSSFSSSNNNNNNSPSAAVGAGVYSNGDDNNENDARSRGLSRRDYYYTASSSSTGPSVSNKMSSGRVNSSSSPHVEACRSLSTPPAVPPRHPLLPTSKDPPSLPLLPRGKDAAPACYPTGKGQLYAAGLGLQTYGVSGSGSGRDSSVCDPAGKAGGRGEDYSGVSRSRQEQSAPLPPAGSGPDGSSLTSGSQEEQLANSYGQPVRLNAKSVVPLFLDKERRTIAKSAVLQSSKC